MGENRSRSPESATLRERAELVAKSSADAAKSLDLTLEEARALVHELQVHQIELEMQNDELHRMQEALVESCDRYTDLYDFAPVGYATVSHEGLILEANLTWASLLGVERRDLIKQRLSDYIVPDDQNIVYRHRRTIHKTNQPDICQLRMPRRGAEPFWAEMESIPFESGNDGKTGLRIAISDITSRKRVEDENHVLQQQVQQAQKLESLGVLAGGIAHDFNNLLVGILGNADLALAQLPTESPARVHVVGVETATRRAADLAQQMLAYSGKGRFDVQWIDLRALVEEMVHLLETSISRSVVIRYDFAQNVPPIEADPTQIRQIVMNLVVNASEAIGDRSGVISIRTGAMDCDRAYLDEMYFENDLTEGVYTYVEIADTGSGIDPETISKIFDPFFSTKFTGRGLGLAATLGIVRGHKGAIKVQSVPGKGTTFRVLFPYRQSPAEMLDAVAVKTSDAKFDGLTVLLVDDEETVRTVGRQMCEQLGLKVTTAEDGREALKLFSRDPNRFDCVILDLTMPHMNGEETFLEMRRIRGDIRIVLSSGYSEHDLISRFKGQNLSGFIQKPYAVADIKETLSKVPGLRQDN
ncbi:MAG: response regulator [Deltaproteobacteria bacterium]|nr:response regulator [Deltaproteobacteria bacterium]